MTIRQTNGLPILLILLFCALRTPLAAASPAPDQTPPLDHSVWNELLGRHVHDGRVDYEGFLAERSLLDRYLASLADANPGDWSENEQKAFWINAYNAWMIATVLDAWPVESVLDIGRLLWVIPTGGAFRIKHRIARMDRSLDDIEHRVLRPRFGDARIHAAVNCASRSCPVLGPEAYRGDRLDAQLDRAMTGFIYDPSRNRIFENPPRLSAIFKWYAGDFESETGSVWSYVTGWLTEDERARILPESKPKHLRYDWSLND